MKSYVNPEISVMNVMEEDVIRTSAEKLMQGEWGMRDLFE